MLYPESRKALRLTLHGGFDRIRNSELGTAPMLEVPGSVRALSPSQGHSRGFAGDLLRSSGQAHHQLRTSPAFHCVGAFANIRTKIASAYPACAAIAPRLGNTFSRKDCPKNRRLRKCFVIRWCSKLAFAAENSCCSYKLPYVQNCKKGVTLTIW